MARRAWTTRIVMLLGAMLLLGSVLSAAMRSSSAPWPLLAQRAAATRPATPDAGRPPLFSDDFSSDPIGTNPPYGWMIADGRWDGVVADGRHVLRHARGAYGHLVAGSAAWTDYSVGATLRPDRLTTGFAGVAARYQDRGDYYACGIYYASAARLWVVRGGRVTLLDARRATIDTSQFHEVRLVVSGTRLSCEIDGTYVLSAVDPSFRTGRIALLAADGEAAEFSAVNVVN
jgi:pectate lyase